jgi:hypothetical protein
VLLVLVAGLLNACEKPDASIQTSPSLKALVGTTTGNVAFNPPETPPPAQDPPARWNLDVGVIRFDQLENGTPSLQVVLQVQSREGAGLELWLENESGVAARWSGGATAVYDGTVCFQLVLQKNGEAIPLAPGKYVATVVLRDPGSGVVAAKRIDVTNAVPRLEGAAPAVGSEVFRDGLACARGS